jgi:hypothetical protein
MAVALAAAPAMAQQKMDKFFEAGKVRALIFSGRNNHEWRATTPFLRRILTDSARFDVRVNEEPAGATAATLAACDVLVLDYEGPRWGAAPEQAVEEFVRSGKGLVVFHAASYPFGDCEVLGDRSVGTGIFEEPWPEYRNMAGAYWSRKEAPITGHGPRRSFPVKFTDRSHPIAEGMGESFIATDELYRSFRLLPGVRVLATAFDDPKLGGTGKDEPILWTLSCGKGRVFHTALGHNLAAIQETGFMSTFARGTEWAATGKVTIGPKQAPKPRIRALVVTGGHACDSTFYTLFEGYPDLAWDHATSNEQAYGKDLRDEYDVLVLYDMHREISETARKNLREFVESNKGVVVLHHALCEYGDWDWWTREVVGGKYRVKPEGPAPGSTYQHDVRSWAMSGRCTSSTRATKACGIRRTSRC